MSKNVTAKCREPQGKTTGIHGVGCGDTGSLIVAVGEGRVKGGRLGSRAAVGLQLGSLESRPDNGECLNALFSSF